MGRYLAIDYGKKRVGVAVSDPLKIIANGLTTVESNKIFDFLKLYFEKEDVELVIVGLPKQLNNEASENMPRVEEFVKKFKEKFPEKEVEYYDERFTSKMAQRTMIDGGLKKKQRMNKALVDEISATIIVKGYMEGIRGF